MSNNPKSKHSRFRCRLLPLLLALILSLSAIPVWADDSVGSGQQTDPAALEELIDLPAGIVEEKAPPVIVPPRNKALTNSADDADEDVLAELRTYADGEIVAEGSEYYCRYVVFRNNDGADTYTIALGAGENSQKLVSFYGSGIYSRYQSNVTRAIIIDGVESVGQYGFHSCPSLISVKLPDSLRNIGEAAFRYCDCLNDVSSLSGNQLAISSIGDEAFFRCGCNGAAIAASISTLDDFAVARAAYSYGWLPPGTTSSATAKTRQLRDVYDRVSDLLTELDVQDRSDIEKIFRIYEWVTDNVEYAYDALEVDSSDQLYLYSASAHRALFEHKAICSGYADLTRFMLNEAGIDCVEINDRTSQGNHAWLIVQLDGKWYAIDPTWDNVSVKSFRGYQYFLRSQATFSEHYWDNYAGFFSEVYPISTKDYGRITSGGYEFEIYTEAHVVITGYKGSATVTSLVLPETVDFNGQQFRIREIGGDVFTKLTKLRRLEIPEGYTTISSGAFCESVKLSSIKLPSTLKRIGETVINLEYTINPTITFNGTLEQISAIEAGDCGLFNYPIKCIDGTFRHPKNLCFAKVKVSPRVFTYNGKVHHPKVTVTAADGTVLTEGVDYELEISNDEDDVVQYVGAYYIGIFSEEGEYFGYNNPETSIIVRPPVTTLKKLTPKTKSMTVYWTKKTSQVGGYQIQYALNKSFTKGRKTVTVKGRSNSSKLIKNLKKGKTYYVRVRTYKYAESYSDNLFSNWSNVKKVKIKR